MTKKKNADKDKKNDGAINWNSVWNASTIGMAFVSSICIGTLMGYYLDAYFKVTKPYLTIFFMIMGIIAGFRNAFYFLKKTDIWNAKDDAAEKDKTDDKKK